MILSIDQNPGFCPICEKNTASVTPYLCNDYLTKHKFCLWKCDNCGTYATQVTSGHTCIDYYGPAYYNSKAGKFLPFIEKQFRFNHERNARFLYRSFRPESVLEIGCGRAYILRELKRLGCRICSLESPDAPEWISNNPEINVIRLSKEQQDTWPFESESFQLVIFWHVLEHLPDPVKALKQATRVLEKGKILCVSVPNVASYQARLSLRNWFHLDVPRHLFHFSKQGLIGLLERQNYEIIKVTSGDAVQNLYGMLQSLANLSTPNGTNALYRFLQGGIPLRTASKTPLLVQILTAPIWLPIGLAGYLIEEIAGHYGTVTIYARKK